jgi:tRNA-Thr(GGU) m(6)t(6)A37 methyltransferase TsaA
MDRRGTPRQPILIPAAKGIIKFNKKLIQYEHYKELENFSHIWVVFVFNFNTNLDANSISAKIKPPRLHGERVGCLSTRAPHRPNPIGLSVCEIVSVTSTHVEVRGIDFVNGTEILDIKPYIPYDVINSDIPLPMATSANGSLLQQTKLSVPNWIYESDIDMKEVRFTKESLDSLDGIIKRETNKRFFKTSNDAIELITQCLRQDIRTIHQGRNSNKDSSKYNNIDTSDVDNE